MGLLRIRLLRCVVLKQIKGWSFRELHPELRVSLLYRRFTRFYEDPIPDFSNLCRAFALFGKETIVNSYTGLPKAPSKQLSHSDGLRRGEPIRRRQGGVR